MMHATSANNYLHCSTPRYELVVLRRRPSVWNVLYGTDLCHHSSSTNLVVHIVAMSLYSIMGKRGKKKTHENNLVDFTNNAGVIPQCSNKLPLPLFLEVERLLNRVEHSWITKHCESGSVMNGFTVDSLHSPAKIIFHCPNIPTSYPGHMEEGKSTLGMRARLPLCRCRSLCNMMMCATR